MKWVVIALALISLVACGEFHEVTFLVESPGLDMATVSVSWRMNNSIHWYGAPVPLPVTAIEHTRHVQATLTAETATDVNGTFTGTILLDGVPIATDSVTASGSPAELVVTAYIPD